MNEEPITGFN